MLLFCRTGFQESPDVNVFTYQLLIKSYKIICDATTIVKVHIAVVMRMFGILWNRNNSILSMNFFKFPRSWSYLYQLYYREYDSQHKHSARYYNTLELSSDKLLCDHIQKCKHIFHNCIADCLEDYSEEEICIIADMTEGLKTSLRARTSQPVQKK